MRFGAVSICGLLSVGSLLTHGAGVTVITHGFNSDISDWVISMAGAVSAYPGLKGTNTSCYEIYFERDSTGQYVTRQRRLSGGNPAEIDSGEIIVKVNWSPFAGDLSGATVSTSDVAPTVAGALMVEGFIPELGGRALAELPLHFIGHSRGGSLICEVSRLLGEKGIWIDQLTTLDPHPLNNDYNDSILTDVIDAPAVVYSNVLFADNYYQINNSFLGLDPSGQNVPGAYNRFLPSTTGGYSGFSPQHSNVHLWYHGTIDWRTPTSDTAATITQAERQAWWTPAEEQGKRAGFLYSLIGGGDRLSTNAPAGGSAMIRNGYNQMWNFGAGTNPSNRHVIEHNSGDWPNLLTFDLVGIEAGQTATVPAGGTLPVRFAYQNGSSGSSNLTVRFFLDRDGNPYNSNSVPFATLPLSGTGISNVTFATNTVSGSETLPQGLYSFAAEINENGKSRFLYTSESVRIVAPLLPPRLDIASLSTGQILLDVHGTSRQTVILEQTSDLRSWVPLSTNLLIGSNLQIPLDAASHHDFFRVRIAE